MQPDIDSLILIFNRLSEHQKNEAVQRLNEYIQGNQITKDRIVKESGQRNAVKKMDVGPTSVAVCVLRTVIPRHFSRWAVTITETSRLAAGHC